MPHTRTWDAAYEAIPADALPETLGQGASRIRNLKVDIRERAEVDHDWDDTTHAGKHKKVTLQQQSGDPTVSGTDVALYTKDVSGAPEAFIKTAALGPFQLTDGAKLAIDDHSADEAEMQTVQAPGETGTPVLPVSLNEELETIRYALKRLGIGVSNGKSWYDEPHRGPSLLENPWFIFHTAGTPNPPDRWALSGAGPMATCALEALPVTEGVGDGLRITCNLTTQGISQTRPGLKASRKYLVVARVKPDISTAVLSTTGGVGAGSFANLSIASASASGVFETLAGIVQTDATPNPLIIKLLGGSNTASFLVRSIDLYECNDEVVSGPRVQALVKSIVAEDVSNVGEEDVEISGTLSLTVPSHAHALLVLGYASGYAVGFGGDLILKLQENINGGGAATVMTTGFATGSTDTAVRACAPIFRLILAPTPGDSYVFTLRGLSKSGTLHIAEGAVAVFVI